MAARRRGGHEMYLIHGHGEEGCRAEQVTGGVGAGCGSPHG
jgi:hypothetical protein